MTDLTPPMARLVDELKRLPGIGAKSAQRMAFYLLGVEKEQAERLAHAISEMRASIQLCEKCNNIAEGPVCPFCSDPNRAQSNGLRDRATHRHHLRREDAPVSRPLPCAARRAIAA